MGLITRLWEICTESFITMSGERVPSIRSTCRSRYHWRYRWPTKVRLPFRIPFLNFCFFIFSLLPFEYPERFQNFQFLANTFYYFYYYYLPRQCRGGTSSSHRTLVGEQIQSVGGGGGNGTMDPDALAETYWYLHIQDRTTWTQEIDLRSSTSVTRFF